MNLTLLSGSDSFCLSVGVVYSARLLFGLLFVVEVTFQKE